MNTSTKSVVLIAVLGFLSIVPSRVRAQNPLPKQGANPPAQVVAKANARQGRKVTVDTDLVLTVAFSRNGKMIAGGGFEKAIRIWDPETGNLVRKLEGPTCTIRSVAFSPDSKILTAGGEPLTIHGDGSQYRQFVYVEDLARAHVFATKKSARNQTYNLEGIQAITIRQVAETIDKLVGGSKIEYLPMPSVALGKTIMSTKAKDELGWEAKIGFDKGMRRTIEWFQQGR